MLAASIARSIRSIRSSRRSSGTTSRRIVYPRSSTSATCGAGSNSVLTLTGLTVRTSARPLKVGQSHLSRAPAGPTGSAGGAGRHQLVVGVAPQVVGEVGQREAQDAVPGRFDHLGVDQPLAVDAGVAEVDAEALGDVADPSRRRRPSPSPRGTPGRRWTGRPAPARARAVHAAHRRRRATVDVGDGDRPLVGPLAPDVVADELDQERVAAGGRGRAAGGTPPADRAAARPRSSRGGPARPRPARPGRACAGRRGAGT